MAAKQGVCQAVPDKATVSSQTTISVSRLCHRSRVDNLLFALEPVLEAEKLMFGFAEP